MKRIILLFLIGFITFSCSKDTDYQLERLELIEYYDGLIEDAYPHEAEMGALQRQMDKKLAELDC